MNANDGTNDAKRPDDQAPSQWGAVNWEAPKPDAQGEPAPANEAPAPDAGHQFGGVFGTRPASSHEDAPQSPEPQVDFGAPAPGDRAFQPGQQFQSEQSPPAFQQPEHSFQPEQQVPSSDTPTPFQPAQQFNVPPAEESVETEQPADAEQPTPVFQPDRQFEPAQPEQVDEPSEPAQPEQPAWFAANADAPSYGEQQTQAYGEGFAAQFSEQDAAAARHEQPTEAFNPNDFANSAPHGQQPFGAPPAALPGDQSTPFGNQYTGADQGGAFAGAAADAAAGQFGEAQPGQSGQGQPGQPGQFGEFGQGQPGAEFGGHQGPQFGGPHGPEGPGGPVSPFQTEEKPKKKKRTGLIVGIAAGAAALLAAGILIPVMIHNGKVAKGDELAAEFNAQVNTYNTMWNQENLDIVTKPDIAGPLQFSGSAFYQMDASAISTACTDREAASTKRTELQDAAIPELPVDEDATASEAYVAAQSTAESLATQRTAADAFLATSDKTLGAMTELCDNLSTYTDLYKTYNDNINGVLADSRTVPNGERVDSPDGQLYWTCASPSGCVNLYDKTLRENYAAAIETTYVGFYRDLANAFDTQCVMSAFAGACAVGATEYGKTADAFQAIATHLRTTEPNLKEGETMYPELDNLAPAADQAIADADSAVANAWNTDHAAWQTDLGRPDAEHTTVGSIGTTGRSIIEYFQFSQDKLKTEASAVLSQ